MRAENRTIIAKGLEEANDFYSDSAKLKSFHILTVDTRLKECLDSLQVTASWIFVAFGYAALIMKDETLGDEFLQDAESRKQLQTILQELESPGSGEAKVERLSIQDEEGGKVAAAKSAIFVHSVIVSLQKMQKDQENQVRLVELAALASFERNGR